MMNSGRLLSGNPCLGTWVTYGLGSENENLPGFVVMLDRTGGPISGAEELVERLHAGGLPGDRAPLRRHADPRPGLARRAPTAPRAGSCSTGSARRTRSTWPPAPTTPSWPRGSPATSWPSRCSSSAPEAVDFAGESRRDPGALRHRPAPHGRLRPQVPDRAAAGRARRPVRPDLLGRRPQRRQLGRPQPTSSPTTPSTPATPTSRSPA